VDVHAFVLMTNHVHLLVTPETEKGVSQLMQSLGRYYVMYINKTYQRTGTLWEGRYKSTLVDSANYFLWVSRYIELNPVRANQWVIGGGAPPLSIPSSYHGNALDKHIALLTAHHCYQSLGTKQEERKRAYQARLEHHIPALTLQEIRDATNKA
jgi:putative transposase